MGFAGKKRLGLNSVKPEAYQKFGQTPESVAAKFDSIKYQWQKVCFLFTEHVTLREGNINCLLTGVNDSGKTNTANSMLPFCNDLLINFWKVTRYKPGYILEHPELAGVPPERYSLEKNCIFIPKPADLNKLLGHEQFLQADFNEGLAAAVNLKSNTGEAVDMGVSSFIFAHLARDHFLRVPDRLPNAQVSGRIYEYMASQDSGGVLRSVHSLHEVQAKGPLASQPAR